MKSKYDENITLQKLVEEYGNEAEGNGRDSVKLQIINREIEKMRDDYIQMREENIRLRAENDDYRHRVLKY